MKKWSLKFIDQKLEMQYQQDEMSRKYEYLCKTYAIFFPLIIAMLVDALLKNSVLDIVISIGACFYVVGSFLYVKCINKDRAQVALIVYNISLTAIQILDLQKENEHYAIAYPRVTVLAILHVSLLGNPDFVNNSIVLSIVMIIKFVSCIIIEFDLNQVFLIPIFLHLMYFFYREDKRNRKYYLKSQESKCYETIFSSLTTRPFFIFEFDSERIQYCISMMGNLETLKLNIDEQLTKQQAFVNIIRTLRVKDCSLESYIHKNQNKSLGVVVNSGNTTLTCLIKYIEIEQTYIMIIEEGESQILQKPLPVKKDKAATLSKVIQLQIRCATEFFKNVRPYLKCSNEIKDVRKFLINLDGLKSQLMVYQHQIMKLSTALNLSKDLEAFQQINLQQMSNGLLKCLHIIQIGKNIRFSTENTQQFQGIIIQFSTLKLLLLEIFLICKDQHVFLQLGYQKMKQKQIIILEIKSFNENVIESIKKSKLLSKILLKIGYYRDIIQLDNNRNLETYLLFLGIQMIIVQDQRILKKN